MHIVGMDTHSENKQRLLQTHLNRPLGYCWQICDNVSERDTYRINLNCLLSKKWSGLVAPLLLSCTVDHCLCMSVKDGQPLQKPHIF